ncbi:MAG TPA: DUF3426 domain-containing protein [Nitrososphaeraceae archaeon]|jgi:hypothetical protein|nr:DUF3426 domain-containing protein [Nitrososphaeraceae archaeon]
MTNSILKVLIPILSAVTIFPTAETLAQKQQDTVNLETSQVELKPGPTNNVELDGQVVNNSTAAVDDVRVNIQFYDSNGQLLLEASRFITQPSQTLQPGESVPFTVLETLGIDQVDEHVVIAEADPAT